MKYPDKKLGRYRKGVIPLSQVKVGSPPPKERQGKNYKMRNKYKATCEKCSNIIEVGAWIWWHSETRKVKHVNCRNGGNG